MAETTTPGSNDPLVKSDDRSSNIRTSKTATIYVTLILFVVVLLLLGIFILQNSQTVKIAYLGFDGHIPLAVAMLFSVVAGALLLALAGGARILQLRHKAFPKE